jgi:hypothetical protein
VKKDEFAARNSAGAMVAALEPPRNVTSMLRSPKVTWVTAPASSFCRNSENAICGGAVGWRAK